VAEVHAMATPIAAALAKATAGPMRSTFAPRQNR
jgi:hypothetical protein